MNIAADQIASLISILGALASGAFAAFGLWQAKKAQRTETHRQIGALYDSLLQYRKEHPELLSLARQWAPARWAAIYNQKSDDDRQWAVYFTYVELCLGFCNTVLYAHVQGQLARGAFSGQYELLVRLLLTEHAPLIGELADHSGYLSAHLLQYLKQQTVQGWDWHERHRLLSRA